jgi:hypothetical protein
MKGYFTECIGEFHNVLILHINRNHTKESWFQYRHKYN